MGGNRDYRREAALDAVLARAADTAARRLPYDEVASAREAFADRRELLLALQYRWSQLLWARIDQLARRRRARHDVAAASAQAWHDCARRHPVLRRLLDEHRAELGPPPERAAA